MTDINKIASIAHQQHRKTSKKDAAYILRQLMGESELPPEKWAPLYSHLLTESAKLTKNMTDEKWVALAIAKNDVRYYLNAAYSDGSRLMATDGHRVHILKDANRAKGYYCTAGDAVEIDGVYPDVDRVIPPADAPEYSAKLSELEVKTVSSRNGKNYDAYILPCGTGIHVVYLLAALGGVTNFKYRVPDSDKRDKAIRIDHGQRLAVIMPVRL